jgi:hypothetical protein
MFTILLIILIILLLVFILLLIMIRTLFAVRRLVCDWLLGLFMICRLVISGFHGVLRNLRWCGYFFRWHFRWHCRRSG